MSVSFSTMPTAEMSTTWSSSYGGTWDSTANGSENSSTLQPPSNATARPPPPSLTDILMRYSDYRMSLDLGLYGSAVLIAVGTITNILTIMVMTRRTLISTSTCFYFALLAAADLLVLYVSTLRRLLFVVHNSRDVYIINEAACHYMDFLAYFAYDLASWIITTMTIDRFIAIRFPLKAASLCTVRNALIAMAIVVVLCVVKNCHFFFTFTISVRGYSCLPHKQHVDFIDEFWPWIDATFYSFLPFSILFIFNVLIIYCHRQAIKRKRTLRAMAGGSILGRPAHMNFNQRLTVVLLIVSFSFMIMTAPKAILFSIREQYFPYILPDKSIDFAMVARYSLVSATFSLLMWTNHSINFFLYCLSGKRFRQELLRMISQCLHRKRNNQVFTSGNPRGQGHAQGQGHTQRIVENSSSSARRESNSSVISECLAPAQAQLPVETEDAVSRVSRWATLTFTERHNQA